MALILFLAFSLFVRGALGDIVCEQLPTELCSFSIASNGRRCVLENYVSPTTERKMEHECKTSQVAVDIMHEWIETNDCIRACGVDRESVGISSDALLQSRFIAKLCSPARYHNCPNIVDLYFNLALGEGVYLANLGKVQRSNPKRVMREARSSGAATGPMGAAPMGTPPGEYYDAPTEAPMYY
ncbi:uncharacterized protein LOC115745891 isoform X3 [Rhodamnia argentea]|uniref:Uncharacterized protein LOC115745891 isoform X3 n=1 Tax=Rhodamnia argentea TaxID=178133 RepID=A0A8B8PTS7_9MYRT|nr:uncharacterized protein LOC115745891 isoform X3 [Rhodamnia argentea]